MTAGARGARSLVAVLAVTVAALTSVPGSAAAATATTDPTRAAGRAAPSAPAVSPVPGIGRERVSVRGRVPGGAARPVVVQLRGTATGGRWKSATRTRSAAQGFWTATLVLPARAGTLSVRAVAPRVRKGPRPLPAWTSPVRRVQVVAQAGSLTLPARVHLGERVAVVARFAPARPGRAVQVQQRRAGRWVTVARGVQDRRGRYATSLVTTADGPAAFRAITAARAGAPAYTTPARTTSVLDPEEFRSLTAGGDHTCGVRHDGTAWCWGDNLHGQLGDGTDDDSPTPVKVGGDATWASLTAGATHTCGIRTDGTGWCWGLGTSGQLGNDGAQSSSSPVPLDVDADERWRSLTAGAMHTCGVTTDGGAWCWGSNAGGRLGATNEPRQTSPHPVVGEATWSSLTAGTSTCGVRTDGTAWCWGGNDYGEVGDGTYSRRNEPVAVTGGGTWSSLDTGARHTCGVRADGSARCWGYNTLGALGDGTTEDRLAPATVTGGAGWSGVGVGASYTCGVRAGKAQCWGDNYSGQLGNGESTEDANTVPRPVSGDARWTFVTAGGHHACGLRADGSAWCWGGNAEGPLGDGTLIERHAPVQVVDAPAAP